MNGQLDYRKCNFFDEDELERLVELQNIVYKERGLVFTNDTFRHWYIDNPDGPVISYNAFDGNKMVAHQSFVPERMLVDRRIVKCLRSMAVVTLPDYRGRGIFSQLTNAAVKDSIRQGYEFIYAVANDNSYPAFIKYCGFSFVTRLNVKMGICRAIQFDEDKTYKRFWTKETLAWRLSQEEYFKSGNAIFGSFKPGIKTFMGIHDDSMLSNITNLKEKIPCGLTLYVGLGAELPWTLFNVPKFIKHSPFNLVYRDLTGGKLPDMTKDNVFYQLMDFDVA